MQRPIYLDNHATTTMDRRVLEAMLPYFCESFGNAASTSHLYGWEAEAAVSSAREVLATAIAAEPEEIVFTSGATEANNLAIKGVAEAYLTKGRHIITMQTEHNAVLDPCAYLESMGFEVTYLPVQTNGLINVTELEQAIRADTVLVSVMAANNEIGVLQPIAQIGQICHDRNVLFHTDAAQAIGKIQLDVQAMHIDLLSITAHKIYGPKGIGGLYVRRKNPRVKLAPQLHGGGHERGMRSGTLYVPQIVGFAKAVALALESQASEQARLQELRDRLWQRLSQLEGVYLNGDATQRLAGNLNISVADVDGQALIVALQKNLAISTGAACSSVKNEPSHVLTALGRSKKLAQASLRFGIGRFNTVAEIDRAADLTIAAIASLQKVNC
ncbi:Cysteine desulfurase [Thalassoporum mexicanum PCC 7367]|uniref:IscS subfamily cysteine desulfurase n=1 Tax=Thalassoporum mexicanum TaxID=3457544 RepID=UPI0002A00071|nr:IscS subfamily cysteine desulfurase [Pseudanabaena sp. PCC 7367]AFY69188.1 Cysteine desulfurase [Pseudanabaena sp. PCC 7367]